MVTNGSMATNGENELGFSWIGLTREIDTVLRNIVWQRKAAHVLPGIRAFFALPTAQCSAYPALFDDALLHVRRCNLTNHLASARAKQVVHDRCSLCLTQQKEFLAPSSTHVVACNSTLSQSRTRFLTTSHCTFIDLESEVASRSFDFLHFFV